MSHTVGAFVDVVPSKQISNPSPTLQKPAPSAIELDQLSWGNQYNGPNDTDSTSPETNTVTPRELEMSSPPSPRLEETSLVQSWSNPPQNKWRILCCCLIYLGNGMSDSAPGALIPYMEKYYGIGYAIVSLIFVTNAVGFIAAAFVTDYLLGLLGRGKALMFAESMMIAGYILIVADLPFGVVVASYPLVGFGYGVNLALNNVFCANLAGSTMILGAAHGSYGIGGIIAPIIATTMVTAGILWSRFFLITLALKFLGLLFAGWSFWNYEREAPTRLLNALERTASRQAAHDAGEPTKLKLLWQAVNNRITLLGALFIFTYQGAEVSISGWIISFLIAYRDGDPAQVGYVTAGFWGGITLGRFFLSPFAHRLGEKLSVYILGIGVIIFQLLVWLIPNAIGNAVAVSFVGLLLGPVYPCAQTVFARLISKRVQTTAIGFIASAGSSGGAVAPFTTGLLAQAVGTYVLHPICIGLFCSMLLSWFSLPITVKRRE